MRKKSTIRKSIFICMILSIVLCLAACGDDLFSTFSTTAGTTTTLESISSNPLIAADLQHGYIRNGSGTDVIGRYAYIKITKSTLEEITLEEYKEFCEDVVDNIIYNWVSIICDDGTGIQFTGSQYTIATYGTITYEGVIIQDIGYIRQTENGFKYEECK